MDAPENRKAASTGARDAYDIPGALIRRAFVVGKAAQALRRSCYPSQKVVEAAGWTEYIQPHYH